jgi:hypothetical protein
MAAAFRAVLTLAERGLLERRHVLGTGSDPYGRRFPQAERVDGSADHDWQETAMAITHRFRRTGDFEFDRAAEAASNMSHGSSSPIRLMRVRSERWG